MDATKLKLPVKDVIAIIVFIASLIGMYYTMKQDIIMLQMQIKQMKEDKTIEMQINEIDNDLRMLKKTVYGIDFL